MITYTYSTVEGAENPNIDYVAKTVTVKFTVTDKYLLESDLIREATDEDGNTIYIPKNINVIVDGIEVYNGNTDIDEQTYSVRTSISSTDIENGKEYTLVVSNLEHNPYYDSFNFSGPMQLVFAEGAIRASKFIINREVGLYDMKDLVK